MTTSTQRTKEHFKGVRGMTNLEKIKTVDIENTNIIFEHKKTKKQYIASTTNTGEVKLFSLENDTGKEDITINADSFISDYEEKE